MKLSELLKSQHETTLKYARESGRYGAALEFIRDEINKGIGSSFHRDALVRYITDVLGDEYEA